jgi:hypothetical protein
VTVAVWEKRVQHEPQRIEKIALPAAVLSDDDRTWLKRQVDISQVAEIPDLDPLELH